MTLTRARGALFATFLGGLAIQLAAVVVTYSAEAISYDELRALISKLLTVYLVPFGVIVGGMFAQRQNASVGNAGDAPFWAAAALALVWNVLLAWRPLAFARAAYDYSAVDNAANVISYLDTIAKDSSFLIAAVLTFYFAKTPTSQG